MKVKAGQIGHKPMPKGNVDKAASTVPAKSDDLYVSQSPSDNVSTQKRTMTSTAAACASVEIQQAFSSHPPAVAAALVGGHEVFRQRAEQLPNVNSTVITSLRDRIGEPEMAVDASLQAAMTDYLDGKFSQRVVDHAPAILSWQSFLGEVGDEKSSRVLHVNMRDLPGVSDLPGLEYYTVRALGLAHSSEDLVVIPDNVPGWVIDELQGYRKQAGLPTGKILSETKWDAQRSEISQDRQVQEFYRSERSEDRENYLLQEKFENKNFCMEFLEGNGVSCPKLFYQGEAKDLDVAKFENQPVVAKRVRSAGGMGVKLCREPGDLRKFIDESKASEEVQLQELVVGTDCSKQYFISEHGAAPVTNTDQIIKNGVNHAGNKILSRIMTPEDNSNADKAAQLIWEQGYRGYMAVDMMKPAEGGVAKVIELNLRKGGVTVPTVIASQLGATRFVAKQVLFESKEQMNQVLSKFSYRAGQSSGLVPFAISPYDDGSLKIEAVFVSPQGGHDVAEQLEQRLKS
ncbi:MAG: ATP-grasp domain-containing protein [Myxococcota bacterium]|nr:ATP-grasp domain-containing protein [Myxococcota bacterium]